VTQDENDVRTERIGQRVSRRKPEAISRDFDRWEKQMHQRTPTENAHQFDVRHERLMREAGQAADH
jgi:hypothetical protein